MVPTIFDFNNYDFNAGNLTSDGGLLLLTTFAQKYGLLDFFKDLPFDDHRKNPDISNEDILMSHLDFILIGNAHSTSRFKMKDDPLFDGITMPSQPTSSRFYDRVTDDTINTFKSELTHQACEQIRKSGQKKVILDQDSTLIETNGDQEYSSYIPHYNETGYHPLLTSEFYSSLNLAAWLRPGNTYASLGAWEQLKPILDELFQDPDMEIVYRADSAGCDSVFIKQLEDTNRIDYTIRMRNSKRFVASVMDQMDSKGIDFNDYTHQNPYIDEIMYSINNSVPRRIVYKAYQTTDKHGQISMFPWVFGVVTNDTSLSPREVLELYEGRGASENVNRDIKGDFGANNLSHSTLMKNELDLLMSCFAYNLYKIFASEILEGSDQNMRMKTFRIYFGKVAAKVVHHARQKMISFAENFWNKDRFSYYLEKVICY